MDLNQIIYRFNMLRIHEERFINEDFLELVFFTEDIDQWAKTLSYILGPPVKPAGTKPSGKNRRDTKKSGGIRVNQTLYEKKFGHFSVIAKFWPWQDGIHTTLKMAKLIE